MNMKNTSKWSIWSFWLPLGLVAVIFLLVTFIGNILVIGAKLGTCHPSIEWAFYIGLTFVFIWLIAIPLIGVLALPVMALDDVANGTNKAGYRTLKKIAQQLVNSGVLPAEHREKLAGAIGLGSDLREPLAAAINAQKESATIIIREHAVLVFVSTAISQSGRLDAIVVLVTNFRLVRTLVKHLGYRPPLPILIKIYTQIFLAALIADGIDDLDVEGIFGQFGFGVLAAIPGLVVDSILDGTINALFTLRVGFVTRKCLLNVGSTLTRAEIRKAANRESRQELKSVIKDALPLIPNAVKKVVQTYV